MSLKCPDLVNLEREVPESRMLCINHSQKKNNFLIGEHKNYFDEKQNQ